MNTMTIWAQGEGRGYTGQVLSQADGSWAAEGSRGEWLGRFETAEKAAQAVKVQWLRRLLVGR